MTVFVWFFIIIMLFRPRTGKIWKKTHKKGKSVWMLRNKMNCFYHSSKCCLFRREINIYISDSTEILYVSLITNRLYNRNKTSHALLRVVAQIMTRAKLWHFSEMLENFFNFPLVFNVLHICEWYFWKKMVVENSTRTF